MPNPIKRPFYWGTATAAFQIEGSPLADGAVASDWYNLTHLPDKIAGGDTADIACDHYRRWEEDIRLMKQLGTNSYRFSTAWPRIYKDKGVINQAGLDFYDRLIDTLGAEGITPFLTLFHWDIPEWMDKKGGWLWEDAPKHYREYANTMFDLLGDRVKHWVTFNEPLIYYHSYITGWHWPFKHTDFDGLLTCWDNIIESHFSAVTDLKARANGGNIGMVHSYHLLEPYTASEEDKAATLRADGFRNRWFLDRLFKGEYPADMLELLKPHVPQNGFQKSPNFVPSDFIGVNYYYTGKVLDKPEMPVLRFGEPQSDYELQPIIPSEPTGLFEMIKRVHEIYQPKDIFITENGYLEYEGTHPEWDPINDVARQKYLKEHLEQIERCLKAGYPVRGYFHWSLLDNFEWRWGMGRRFGLVYVDRETQNRTVKNSGWFYRDYIQNHQCNSK